jgi:threonine/homoserine/homoserine lactone efflux protein
MANGRKMWKIEKIVGYLTYFGFEILEQKQSAGPQRDTKKNVSKLLVAREAEFTGA